MSAWRAGPIDAELRFRVSPFARARLAGAERDQVLPRRKEVYRVSSPAGESAAAVALGSDAFELELVVAGEAKYEAHPHRRGFRASCALKLALSTATAPAAFAKVKCD